MDQSTGAKREDLMYELIRNSIPELTRQQLDDFILVQSADQQEWIRTGEVMIVAASIVVDMREQNYPAIALSMSAEEAQALDLFKQIRANIPGLTMDQLLTFTQAQSAERQRWFQVASTSEIVDWITVHYHSAQVPEVDITSPNFGRSQPRDKVLDNFTDEILKRSAQRQGQAQRTSAPTSTHAPEKANEPGVEICSECGEKMPPGAITCPNCGNTKWGCLLGIVIFIVIMIAAVVDLVNNQHIFWAVVVSVLPLGAVIALISFLVDAFKHS